MKEELSVKEMQFGNAFRHSGEGYGLLYLLASGHRLLDHNRRLGRVEVDLITLDLQGVLHFVEVKAWKENPSVHPLKSQNAFRRNLLRKAAGIFLATNRFFQSQEYSCTENHPLLTRNDLCADFTGEVSFDLLWVHPETGKVEEFPAIF